jgi:hypothetical protein
MSLVALALHSLQYGGGVYHILFWVAWAFVMYWLCVAVVRLLNMIPWTY